jgi:hypothetical protein
VERAYLDTRFGEVTGKAASDREELMSGASMSLPLFLFELIISREKAAISTFVFYEFA